MLLLPWIVLTFSAGKGRGEEEEGVRQSLCFIHCGDRPTNCLPDSSLITRIDLTSCNLSSIPSTFFRNDPDIGRSIGSIEKINLGDNSIDPSEFSLDSMRGMTNLSELILPERFEKCPGQDDAWTKQRAGNSTLECIPAPKYCNVLGHEYAHNKSIATVCPSNSDCVNDGPGLIRCECEAEYYGYKCLRKGKFPFALFYGVLGTFTVVLSAFLWFTQRRHVKKTQ